MVLTVHHLQISQSERVPWLCEELGIPYELKNYKRAPILAPAEYKALHPVGSSPVIVDGDVTLAESGACVEYICRVHGGDTSLFPGPSSPNYAQFLYWWHASNGSLQPAISAGMRTRGLPVEDLGRKTTDSKIKSMLEQVDRQVAKGGYLAGNELTAADIMAVFSLSTMRYFFPVDLTGFDGILGYLKRVSERPAYKRAMEKGDPGLKLVLGAEPPSKEERKLPFETVKLN